MKDKRLLFAVWVVLAAMAASAAVKTEKNVAYAALGFCGVCPQKGPVK